MPSARGWVHVLAILFGVALVSGCGGPAGDPGTPGDDTRHAKPGEAAYAVFRDRSVLIPDLEMPVAVPVAGTASPRSLHSDDREVVSVSTDGSLVGHRVGWTVIRGSGGSALNVEVRAIKELSIQLERTSLGPNESQRITVLSDNVPVALNAIKWSTSNAGAAWAQLDTLRSGRISDSVTLSAHVGSHTAEVQVDVDAASVSHTLAAPSKMSLGQIVRFEVWPDTMLAAASWTSGRPGILTHIGGGFFHAASPGKAQACATIPTSSEQLCQIIEVTP